MEIPFDLGTIFDSECVRLDAAAFKKYNTRKFPFFENFVDKLGKLSAEAQKLKRVLTSYDKILESVDHQILYLLWEPKNDSVHGILGFLKVGRRKLYLYDRDKVECHHRYPICVLDFYVHFSRQRQGNGKKLFDAMLQGENISPAMVAIDKPSDSLLAFLQKHYGLSDPLWQNTNIVVFPDFFLTQDVLPQQALRIPDEDNGDLTLQNLTVNVGEGSQTVTFDSSEVNEPETLGVSQLSPLKVPISPTMISPVSEDTSSAISYGNVSAVASPTNSSQLAKNRKITALGHQKLW